MSSSYYHNACYNIKDSLDNFKIYGRCPLTDNGLAIDWGGSGIVFNADCQGDITIKYIKPTSITIYFTVYIDGERVAKRYPLSELSGEFTVATGLPRGKHQIEIYKQNQIEAPLLCEFTEIALNGILLDKPEDPSLKIEFIGDSITSGMCNLGLNGINGCEPEYCDTTQAYAFLTGKALNADFSIIAQGGASYTPDTGTGNQITKFYEFTDFVRYPGVQWQFKDDADIVVINLGTNDFMKSLDEITQYATSFGKTVMGYYPSAKFILCYGMMGGAATESLKTAVSNLGGSSNNIYYLQLPQNNEGSGAHPNVKGNEHAAAVLIDFIQNTILNS